MQPRPPLTGVSRALRAQNKGRPNHDHDHFWAHLAGPHFAFLGYPRMTHQTPLLHNGTQRNHKDVSSDVPSNAVLVWHQMQNFFEKLWLWLCLGRPLQNPERVSKESPGPSGQGLQRCPKQSQNSLRNLKTFESILGHFGVGLPKSQRSVCRSHF